MKSGAFVISWRRDDGKMYATTAWMNEGADLSCLCKTYKARWRVDFVLLCSSKKEALEIAFAWIDGWKARGEYANAFFPEDRKEA